MNYNEMVKALEAQHGQAWKYLKQNYSVLNELEFIERRENRPDFDACFVDYAVERINHIAENVLTPATIEVGDGVTVNLYTDRHAATVIKKTATTVTVRRDKAILDPNFKPEWVVGGFAGHCTNQEEQSYTYEEDPEGCVYTFRWSNKYGRYGQPNDLTLSKGRHEFYDYNF